MNLRKVLAVISPKDLKLINRLMKNPQVFFRFVNNLLGMINDDYSLEAENKD